MPMAEGEMWADGSGRAFALGAAYVALRYCDGLPPLKPREAVECAIAAAMRYDDGCGGDMWTKRIDGTS